MGLFKESDLRARADRGTPLQKSAGAIISEKFEASAQVEEFDIFLSHSLNDQKLILGIWLSLEDMGYKVYVDWIHDRHLSRDSVTKETAHVLRLRMQSSKSLFFATTASSSASRWMPWAPERGRLAAPIERTRCWNADLLLWYLLVTIDRFFLSSVNHSPYALKK
ncbi:toll-Interleukin receptor [Ralstonia syzygii]|uniref:Toll-Interleukin receptor n=1 Tax=Ralstonia syzygii TaxID=28097 RepID=A0ABX7ZGY5_9RALS|nr:hypothetical protein [Ralstonia syzygii]QUP54616.1 toll-Interleukin receptor [Ralstonia syzygii]